MKILSVKQYSKFLLLTLYLSTSDINFIPFFLTGLFRASEVVKIDLKSPSHPLNPNFRPTISKIIRQTQHRQGNKTVKYYYCKLAEFPKKKTYRLTEEEFNSFHKDHPHYLQ